MQSEQHISDDQHQHYRKLMEIQYRIGVESDITRLPDIVMREVSELLGTDRSTLFLLDWDTMRLRACFAQGIENNAIVVPLQMGIVGAAILQRRIFNVVNAHQHPYFNTNIDNLTGYKTDSIMASPIIGDDGTMLGGVELLNKTTGRFTKEDERIFTVAVQRLGRLMQEGELDMQRSRSEMDVLHGQIGFDRSSIFVTDSATGQLTAMYSEGLEGNTITLNIKLGIAGLVALTNRMLLIPDAVSDPRFDSSFDKLTGYHTRNILCVPLRGSNGEALGAIQMINKLSGDFNEQDVEMLTGVAGIVSIAIENAMLHKDSERQFHSVLEALAASIDARDTLTAGHSQKVAQIAVGIGSSMGFTEADLDVLRVSAILHDYGKIGVDDCVLKKNGKLDVAEFTHMKQHAKITCDILEKIHFSRKYRGVPLIASSHHEYLDGSGYPSGLDASEIPFMAKILTVADVYEALTSDRHYRKGMTPEQALDILQQNVDNHKFDGGVLAALKLFLAQGQTPS
jgi:HD-GYP domain-containing protein (c-di-GMP phosphodiesterase class II)